MYLDSGKIASTFFTFCGFVARFGPIASTASLASVHTEFSLSCVIASVMGSEVPCPQREPVEQLDVDGVVNMFDVGVVFSPPPPPPPTSLKWVDSRLLFSIYCGHLGYIQHLPPNHML